MTRHVFLLLYALAISVNAFAVDIDLQEVIVAGLPVMYVETVNGELPTYRSVSSPPGGKGHGRYRANLLHRDGSARRETHEGHLHQERREIRQLVITSCRTLISSSRGGC